MEIIKIYVFFILVSILSACSVSPNVTAENANLIQAAAHLNSGEFDRQLNRKALNLSTSDADLEQAKEKQQILQKNLHQSRQELIQAKVLLTAIEIENKNLYSQIKHLKSTTTKQKAKKSRAFSKVTQLRNQTKKLSQRIKQQQAIPYIPKKSAPKPALPNPYKTQLASLQKEVNVLREMLVND